jgi:hypothetical protein
MVVQATLAAANSASSVRTGPAEFTQACKVPHWTEGITGQSSGRRTGAVDFFSG